MAERLGDPGEVAFVLGVSVIATFSPDLLEQRLHYIDTQLERSACSGHLEAACEAYGWRATSLVEAGRPDTVRDDVEGMQHLADQLGQPWYRAMAQQRRAMVAQLSGDYETAEALADESLAAAPQQQLAVLAGYAGLTWTVRRDQGRLAEVEPALLAFAEMTPDVPAWKATIAVTALELGRPDDARAELDTLVQRGLLSIPKDWLWLATTVLASEVAAAVAEPDLVGELLALLRPYQRRGVPVAIGVGYLGTTSRALGLLASRLGDQATAIADLTDALDIETRIGAPAYEARTMVALARAHVDRAEPHDADRAADLLLDARAIAERLDLRTVASDAVHSAERGPAVRPGRAAAAAQAPWAGSRISSAGRCSDPGPARACTDRASSCSPQDEQLGTTVAWCRHALCSITTGGPSAASHVSPHCRRAVRTSHRSRPLSVSR